MAKTLRSISVKSNLTAHRIYPMPNTKRSIEKLKTVAMVFDKEQARALATRLLAASEGWDRIAVTGFRLRPRKSDGKFIVTVTSPGKALDQASEE